MKAAEFDSDGYLGKAEYDVFLSYNRRDRDIVLVLAEALRDRGVKVWLDVWSIRPGVPWQEELEKALQRSGAAAVVVGQEGLGPWQRPEIQSLLDRAARSYSEFPVVPVLLQGAQESKLPLLLKRHTWVDLRNGIDEAGIEMLQWGLTGEEPKGPPRLRIKIASPGESWGAWAPPPNTVDTFRYIDTPLHGRMPLWRKIPAGVFVMGSPNSEVENFYIKERQRRVRILDPFRMMAVPVTQGQFQCFIESTGYITDAQKEGESTVMVNSEDIKKSPASWRDSGGKNRPVVHVSRNDAVAFCKWLTELLGEIACLPTGKEWEYACRAGTQTTYWSGDTEADLDRVGWYSKNADSRTHDVGEKPANPWGLYDMHGNVYEWTRSYWDRGLEWWATRGVHSIRVPSRCAVPTKEADHRRLAVLTVDSA